MEPNYSAMRVSDHRDGSEPNDSIAQRECYCDRVPKNSIMTGNQIQGLLSPLRMLKVPFCHLSAMICVNTLQDVEGEPPDIFQVV